MQKGISKFILRVTIPLLGIMLFIADYVLLFSKYTPGTARELNASSQDLKSYVLVLLLSNILIISIIIYVIVKRMYTRNLMEVNSLMIEMASGERDFSKKMDVGTSGEIAKHLTEFIAKLNHLILQIKQGSEVIQDQSGILSVSSSNLRNNNNEIISQLSSIYSAIEQFASSIQEVAHNADKAKTLTMSCADNISISAAEIQNINKQNKMTIDDIEYFVQNDLKNLEKKAEDIFGIVGVINDIADKTEMLALNAAIESAHAGEAGRAFLVVADEIKKLATKTTVSTNEITMMVNDMRSNVNNVVDSMVNNLKNLIELSDRVKSTGSHIQNIDTKIGDILNEIMNVASATQEQGRVADNMSHGLNLTYNNMKDNSAFVSELAQMSERMLKISNEVNSITEGFKLMESSKIVLITKATASWFWQAINGGARKAAAEFEVELIHKGPRSEDDIEGQIQLVNSYIKPGIDAIVLSPSNSKLLIDPVKRAVAQGIKVIILDSLLDGNDYLSFVGIDNYAGGKMGMEYLAQALGGKGNVMLFRIDKNSSNTEERAQGFVESLKQYGQNLKLVYDGYLGNTMPEVCKSVTSLLKDGNVPDGIFCVNEVSASGTYEILKMNKLLSKVKLVAFDTDEDLLNGLRNNEVYGLIAQDPFNMGYMGVKTAIQAIRKMPVEPIVKLPLKLVTPENVDSPEVKQLLSRS